MNLKRVLIISASLLLVFGVMNSCKKNDEEKVNQFAVDVQAILTENVVDAGHMGAAVFARDLEGNEAWTGVGSMDFQNTGNMNKDSKFRIASVSKPYLATVVLQLMEEGKLELENPYSYYLPDSISNLFPYGGQATIMELLNHTSGIYDFEDDLFIMALLTDPQYHWTPWDLLVHAATSELAEFFEPGTICSYSNTNYILLGLIVEAVTGKSMEQNFDLRIFTPLNLENTISWQEPISLQNCAEGKMISYDGSVMEITEESLPLYFEWAHGQMISTVHDMFTFFNALGAGQLFSNTETLDLMFTGSPLSPEESYGLGIFLYHNEYGIGHSGGTLGFITYVMMNPETNFVNIICFNEFDVSDPNNNEYMENTLVAINELIFKEE